ncbi:MAG: biopolymer transporter ExbD, partial [Verrucomicrobiota bacterium]
LSSSAELIVINVRKNNAYVVLNQQVTVEEMTEMIRQSVKESPDIKVLVRADQESLHGYVARAISVCKQAGIPEAHIGYQLPK